MANNNIQDEVVNHTALQLALEVGCAGTRAAILKRYLPSSPSRRFGGGMSMIFFKITGKSPRVLVPSSIVTETSSVAILPRRSRDA